MALISDSRIRSSEFQSIYTYKRRWNFERLAEEETRQISFNPFIPTRGVGMPRNNPCKSLLGMFQSIYTYKRRWNLYP